MTRLNLFLATFILLLAPGLSEVSRQECQEQGGQVVGDIGDGAIFGSDYLCEVNNLPPTDVVVSNSGEPIAIEGEVCCGGTGDGLAHTSETPDREEYTREECLDNGGIVVGDIGDGSIFQEGYVCESNGESPMANIVQTEEPFAIEGEVCCGGQMIMPISGGLDLNDTSIPNNTTSREEYTRQECLDNGGVVVGDIGDGSIFQEDYVCETTGESPIADITQTEEPFAIEWEVCCGGLALNDTSIPANTTSREEYTRQECLDNGGVVVGDIGDGSIFQEDYVCETTGESPIADISQMEEPFAIEGEVCCGGLPDNTTSREEYTRQECLENGGVVVGDIGDGSIFEADYVCESNGESPIADIAQTEDPIAIDGEVCCGEGEAPIDTASRSNITRQECSDRGGEIVGDIGDGATQDEDYVCERSGEAPVANIIAGEGEPIASEGEVCCGMPEDSASVSAPKVTLAVITFFGALFSWSW